MVTFKKPSNLSYYLAMLKNLLLPLLLVIGLFGCKPVNGPSSNESDSIYGSLDINGDTLRISARNWQKLTLSDDEYPFSTEGDLACTSNAVFFYPEQSFTETSIGTPLNQEAVNFLNDQHWQATVPNRVKPGADLRKAISLGLSICTYNRLAFRAH